MEQMPKKVNFFERLRNNSLVMAVSLAGALSAASWLGREASKASLEDSAVAEMREHIKIRVPAVKVEVRVKSENQYIVHIMQVHQYNNSLNETVDYTNKHIEGGFQSLISAQKEIEKIILELIGKYNSKTFFIEGLTAEDINKLNQGIASLSETSGDKLLDFEKLYSKYQGQKENQRHLEDAVRAFYMYSILQAADKILASGGVDKNSAGYEKMAEKRQEIANDPLIKGDNIYVWGADRKLWIEGKIKVASAESSTIKEQLKNSKDSAQKILDENYDLIVEGRSRMAIDEIIKSKMAEKYVPIIFGSSHDLETAVGNHKDVGLVEIISPAVRGAVNL